MVDADIDAYRVLQVRPDAAAAVINAAYRALARLLHPDAPGGDPQRMAELNRAFALVGNVPARQAYDARVSRPSWVATGPGVGGAAPRAPVDPERLDFGRYAGWTLVQLARHDPDYLRWLSRHSAGIRFRNRIAELLPAGERVGRRADFTTSY